MGDLLRRCDQARQPAVGEAQRVTTAEDQFGDVRQLMQGLQCGLPVIALFSYVLPDPFD